MMEDERWLTDSKDMSLSKLWEIVKDRYAAVHGICRESETSYQLNNSVLI